DLGVGRRSAQPRWNHHAGRPASRADRQPRALSRWLARRHAGRWRGAVSRNPRSRNGVGGTQCSPPAYQEGAVAFAGSGARERSNARDAAAAAALNHKTRRRHMIRKAKAVWRGTGRAGNGQLSTDSGVLADTPYSFRTRFENEKGTNPEELIAAA